MAPVESATLAEATRNGINLSANAFTLCNGWVAGPLLMEFVSKFLKPLLKKPMTLKEVTSLVDAEDGPAAVMLRTCTILGYLDFDRFTGKYTARQGLELSELDTLLRPSSPVARALASIYSDSPPPFRVPSAEATNCLLVWNDHRVTWQRCKSKSLALLLDGIVLAPLLTSITYYARWDDEGLDSGRPEKVERLDLSKLDPAARGTVGDMFRELGVGTMDRSGFSTLTKAGSLALTRCYSFYVPLSYAPMMCRFNDIMFDDAAWGFLDVGQDTGETEIHVHRVLNVVGSGAQHQTLFKDMMRHVGLVFAGENFSSQPKFVADTGSGDGHLLQAVYHFVKDNTPRGKVLSKYPLVCLGIDYNEESRIATSVNLMKDEIPHMVMFGDIGDPAHIINTLKEKKIDLTQVLHVRSFLDHDRPYIQAARPLPKGSNVEYFAKTQLADFVHLNKRGRPIPACDLFASLVDHFDRWGDALAGSFGLCLLEVMMLDVDTTKRFFNDCVSFNFDVVQALSRQYMITPQAFVLAAGMAGLMPVNFKAVQTYPEEARYCRIINQHLVRKPFKVRFAEISDLPALIILENMAWDENLAAPEPVIRKRLETSPNGCFVCTIDGKIVAALFTQRIADPDVSKVDEMPSDVSGFLNLTDLCVPDGPVVELISISTDPEFSKLGVGSDLRQFALHLARMDPTVDSVVGITRCRDFPKYAGTMDEYLREHVSGTLLDPIVDFHTSYGAKFRRLVHNFRPEDTDNQAIGVLIQYEINDPAWLEFGLKKKDDRAKDQGAEGEGEQAPTLELLGVIMEELGYTLDDSNIAKGFFDYGMDSLELVRIRNKLSTILSVDLPPTLLLDYPTAKDLSEHLDQERGVGRERAALGDAYLDDDFVTSGWSQVTAEDIIAMQTELKRIYLQPEYQKKFAKLTKKCYPDMIKYIQSVEPILVETEGPLFLERGLVTSTDWDSVQRARGHVTKLLLELGMWTANEEVSRRGTELIRITKQDQYWD